MEKGEDTPFESPEYLPDDGVVAEAVEAGPEATGAASKLPQPTSVDARTLVAEAFADKAEPTVATVVAAPKPADPTEVAQKGESWPRLRIRAADPLDVPRLAEIDLDRFEDTYGEHRPSPAEVRTMLYSRLERAGSWMIVVEVGGVVEGFMTCQLTNKTPEDFVSWEESTDGGTLESTFDPRGKRLYIVNLTVMPRAAKYHGTDMLIGYMYGKHVQKGTQYAMLSSRMPNFRDWLVNDHGFSTAELAGLPAAQLDLLASEYMGSKVEVGGKSKSRDPQIRRYEDAGVKMVRVVRNAFEDPTSLNYGVLGVVSNPLPKWLRKIPPVRWLAGGAVKLAAQSPRLMAKIF